MKASLVRAAACALLLTAGSASAAPAPKTQVIVVGSGLSGLIAAYELERQGVSVHLLEAADRFGGRVTTMHYGEGLHSEYGMHEIWERDPLMDYVREFKIPLSEPEEPYSSVYMDGKLFPYVQDTLDAFHATLFSPQERAAYGRWLAQTQTLYDEAESSGLTPRLSELQKLSFAQWVESFKLPARVAEYIRLGVECEVAADWTGISAVYGIEQMRIFLHGTEQCRHAQGGNQTLIDAFVRRLKGPKTLGATVTRVVRRKTEGGGTEAVVHYRKDNAMRSVKAAKVVLAVPYHVLHAVQLEPGLTETQWKAVDALSAGRYTVVHFIIGAGGAESLLVDGKVPFPVLTRGPLGVVYGFLEKPAPSQKKVVFTLLVHGDHTRTYLEPTDKVRAGLLAELDKVWPGFSGHVQETYFYGYHPAAIAAWPPGHSALDPLHLSLREENAGLFLAGDYLYSSHADGAVRAGRAAAQKAAASLLKAPVVGR